MAQHFRRARRRPATGPATVRGDIRFGLLFAIAAWLLAAGLIQLVRSL